MSTEHNRSIQKYYGDRAKDYDEQKKRTWNSKEGFSSRIIDLVLRLLSNMQKGPILEVGVGSGRVASLLLQEVNSKLIGLDISSEMLNLSKKSLSIHPNKYCLTLGNGELLPIRSGILNGLICIRVFHYFLSPENVLMEFSRSLKDRGVFIYGDLTLHEQDTSGFLNRFENCISYAHARYYTPSGMKLLIEDSGIKVDYIDTISYQKS